MILGARTSLVLSNSFMMNEVRITQLILEIDGISEIMLSISGKILETL